MRSPGEVLKAAVERTGDAARQLAGCEIGVSWRSATRPVWNYGAAGYVMKYEDNLLLSSTRWS